MNVGMFLALSISSYEILVMKSKITELDAVLGLVFPQSIGNMEILGDFEGHRSIWIPLSSGR